MVDECVQTLDTAVRGKDSWIRRGRGEGEGEGEGEERGFEGGEKRGESALFLLTGLEEGKREKEGGREGGRELKGGREGESSRERGREGGGYEGEGRESSSYPAITKAWWSHCSPISLRENTTVSKLKCLNTHTRWRILQPSFLRVQYTRTRLGTDKPFHERKLAPATVPFPGLLPDDPAYKTQEEEA